MRAKISLVCLLVLGVPLRARAHSRHVSEDQQRRALMSELAAAAAEAPKEQRTDADLMYDAMRQWRGEPRGTAAVNKVIAESKKDHAERKDLESKAKTLFFKDPFADDPSELIPVRKVDRMLLANYEARHDIDRTSRGSDEVSRLRDQLAQARADAAAAHAEASRLRTELARAGSDKGDGECVALASHPSTSHPQRVHGSRPMQSNDRDSDLVEAAAAPVVRHHHRAKPRPAPEAVAAAAPAQPEVAPDTAPAGWQSSDPRGIIVVPIDTPVSISASVHR
jgi:hypothetical protein